MSTGGRARRAVLSLALFFMAVYALSSFGTAISIGTAPGVMDLGEVKRGKTYSVDFYLITNADNPILTGLSYNPPQAIVMNGNVTNQYDFIPMWASEEDTSDWVDIVQKELVVDPSKTTKIQFANEVVQANQKARFKLTVPPDAEPGYHAFEIKINPKRNYGGTDGVGVSTIGITRPVFMFKVPGDAKRGGKIDGITASRTGDAARIDVLFRNTGTVTQTARVSSLKIYNETGYYLKTLESGPDRVAPGTTSVLQTKWFDEDPEERKVRRVEATVSYQTGKVTKEARVTIPKKTVLGDATGGTEAKTVLPTWLMIILIGFTALIVYYRYM